MARTPTDPTKAQVWVTRRGNSFDFEFYFPQGPKGDAGGFVSPTALADQTDLNQVVVSGDYRITSTFATLLLNFPRASMGGMLRVVATTGASPIVHQMVLPLPAQNVRGIYQRSLVSGIWSPWQFLGSQVTDQAAGRTITTWDDTNSRSQLIYGDTGWRECKDELLNGVSSYFRVRRVDGIVYLWLQGWNKAADKTFADSIYTLPSGFRPLNSSVFMAYIGDEAGAATRLVVSNMGVIGRTYNNPAGTMYANFSYPTNDVWPTTLPGVAVGGIPNL